MSVQDSIITTLNKVIDNRQVTTVIVSAALVASAASCTDCSTATCGIGRVSAATIFDQCPG